MLRSLYSGISGLRSHQTMLDVTGNNIANVNTAAFKASAVQFQDTLSQLTSGAGSPQEQIGGTNPAQVGLGVRVAGISTNFAQGSAQATGRASDLMISGDGFFVTKLGGQTLYTRAGSFDFDAAGNMVAPDGSLVQGWPATNGVVNENGPLGNIVLPRGAVSPGTRTTSTQFTGNLPSDAAVGTALVRDVKVYDAAGTERSVSLTFTKSATGWDIAGVDANGATATGTLTFDAAGALTAGGSLTLGGIAVDMTKLTGYAKLSTVAATKTDGNAAGTLQSYTLSADGTLVGSFSNGSSQALGRVVLATFPNPGGLEKAGSSSYIATFNSGEAEVGAPGSGSIGSLTSGALEMSNVDLSQEFTNLIVAQRGFQANARIITTSDEVLQELTNLKR
ncbi:flagellar hook protein FlgE [Lacisediminihabitans changchengi]|uniref:Flagellar hook protein FlgE n=1 Tax=Lacisediminihabitans changchengi TaxID=2787634 RepID=A0A934W4V8_9MICO|nr:flagellar hook protein FlgE [Lacisediminihabitans changchengi]MBK4348679.1 flagellar hook protein FlgE [Lacisediminihabitans changchengi]